MHGHPPLIGHVHVREGAREAVLGRGERIEAFPIQVRVAQLALVATAAKPIAVNVFFMDPPLITG